MTKSVDIANCSDYYYDHKSWKGCNSRTRCLPSLNLNLGYVLTFSFFMVVVIINFEERIKDNPLQIDFHYSQVYSLFFYDNSVYNLRVNPKSII